MSEDSPRVALLKRRLKAREGKKEYEKNCEALRAEIARLEGRELDL